MLGHTSIKLKNNKKNKYLAKFSTVKEILRKHNQRKDNLKLPFDIKPMLSNPHLTFAEQFFKEDQSDTFHEISKFNASTINYFDINSDVVSFAKNYQQILQIRNNAIEQYKANTGNHLGKKYKTNIIKSKLRSKSELKPICFPKIKCTKLNTMNQCTLSELQKNLSDNYLTKSNFGKTGPQNPKTPKPQNPLY